MIDLKFNRVSKRYRIRQEAPASATGIAARFSAWTRPPTDFWAVQNVSFEVRRGEALGIIGHNGAGKSTVLKMLSNITAPTTGEIVIHGRIAALLEVGSGFHPELTGRENIYLSGAILGMRRAEIAKKLDRIIDYAELRPFMDVPVKRYSTGMFVRLGFSIAAHLDADILLLDEVLAVGDAAFQEKCAQRFLDLKNAGTTVVFVSHDLTAVERLCDRVLLLDRGEIAADGPPAAVIARYQSLVAFRASSRGGHEHAGLRKTVEIVSVYFLDPSGARTSLFRTGDPFRVCVEYVAHEDAVDIEAGVFFYTPEDALQCQLSTRADSKRLDLNQGRGAIEFSSAALGLQPGLYAVDATLEQHGATMLDWQYRCTSIHVDKGKLGRGAFYMPHDWRLIEEDGTATGYSPS